MLGRGGENSKEEGGGGGGGGERERDASEGLDHESS